MINFLKYELALFAGIGGGILGGHLAGLQCIGSVENNTYSNGVLLRRQNEGHISPFPVWDDITTLGIDNFDTSGYIEKLRDISGQLIISAGFPCQDISRAGKGAGIEGENSGLWKEVIRLVREIRPRALFMENSTSLNNRGLDRILWELAQEGYHAQWDVFGANDAGSPQIRHRLWILAHTDRVYDRRKFDKTALSKSTKKAKKQKTEFKPVRSRFSNASQDQGKNRQWPTEPEMGRMVDGFPYRLVQRERIGNAQVPAVAAMALTELLKYTDILVCNDNFLSNDNSLSTAGTQLNAEGERARTAIS
jgi:DNA (cytosine-5)-methyltransferase 1